MSLQTQFHSDRGSALVSVPERKGESITVEVWTPPHGAVTVQVHTRHDAFKLVGMLLGEDATVVSSTDPVPS